MPKPQRPLDVKFWERCPADRPIDGCWVFNNSKNGGRGYVWHNRRLLMAHRVSWVVHYGPIPVGVNVLHSCDNPPCVNPNHLFLGTQQDNVDDMVRKGRQASIDLTVRVGQQNGMSKLSDTDRYRLLELRRQGWLRKDLANEFGITESQVGRICRRGGVLVGMPKSWTDSQRAAIMSSRKLRSRKEKL